MKDPGQVKSCVCISLITRVPVLEKAASLMIFSRALVPLRGPLGLREGQGFPVLTQEGRGVGEAERQAPGPLLLPFPRSTLRWKAALWPQGSVSIPEFQHPVPASGEQVLFVWGWGGVLVGQSQSLCLGQTPQREMNSPPHCPRSACCLPWGLESPGQQTASVSA